ncbi:MAG: peptidyl-prolyl cis-trans isomerase [Thermodesulfobacteriota bacterium]|nr:peptidyl-prolyl cis-trans isomerase [Thermodesulfobacteriota bacterium]
MLELMRKHARNWIMKVLLAIIIIVFVFYFGSMTGRHKADAIATVDGKIITYLEYEKGYRELVDLYNRRSGGRLTEEMMKALNLKQQALDKLVYQAILIKKAQDLKVKVTDEEIKEFISSLPAFQRNGVFDDRQYQQMLRYNKITPEDFENEQRKSLLIMKLEDLLRDGVHVSDQEVNSFYETQTEKINIAFVRLGARDFEGKVQPSTSDLEKYLKENSGDFRLPEQIQIKYLFFPARDFTAKVNVPEDEIADFYNTHKQQWTKAGKTIPLSSVRDEIVADLKHSRAMRLAYGEAKKARETIYQQENFDAYAAAHSLPVSGTDFFTAKNPPETFRQLPDFAKTVFALQKDEISNVIAAEKGYYLLKAGAKKAAYTPELKIVEKEVRQRYATQEGGRLAKQEADMILARLKKGDKLQIIGKEKNLKLEETGLFLPTAPAPKIGTSPQIMKTLFQLSAKKPYGEEVIFINGDYFLVEFRERAQSDRQLPPEQQEQLKKVYLNLKRNEVIQAWMEESKNALIKAGRLKITKDLKDL